MFYQNSNRASITSEWDRENKRLWVYRDNYPFVDIINKNFSLDELADLRDMIEEILDLEGYKE